MFIYKPLSMWFTANGSPRFRISQRIVYTNPIHLFFFSNKPPNNDVVMNKNPDKIHEI